MLNADIINTPVSCDITEFLLLDQSVPGLKQLNVSLILHTYLFYVSDCLLKKKTLCLNFKYYFKMKLTHLFFNNGHFWRDVNEQKILNLLVKWVELSHFSSSARRCQLCVLPAWSPLLWLRSPSRRSHWSLAALVQRQRKWGMLGKYPSVDPEAETFPYCKRKYLWMLFVCFIQYHWKGRGKLLGPNWGT